MTGSFDYDDWYSDYTVGCQEFYGIDSGSADMQIAPTVQILRDGQPITSTQNVIVGQRINLSVQIITGTSSQQVSSQQWTIPDKAVSKFETLDANGNPDNSRTPAMGRPAAIPNTKLTSGSVDFIWYDGGNKEVQYQATVNGVSVNATATFNVQRPTSVLTAVGGNTKVDNNQPQLYLGGVTNANVGIIITRGTTVIPNGFSGDFQFVQLISGQVIRRPIKQQNSTTNIPGGSLDGCYRISQTNQIILMTRRVLI